MKTKRTMKNLVIHKETISNLNGTDAGDIKGGVSDGFCSSPCPTRIEGVMSLTKCNNTLDWNKITFELTKNIDLDILQRDSRWRR